MGMVGRTRLDCVLGTAAGMRQGVAEALWHTRHRAAFGRLLADQPLMVNVLADLALESEAATATAMRLARAYDEPAGSAHDDGDPSWRAGARGAPDASSWSPGSTTAGVGSFGARAPSTTAGVGSFGARAPSTTAELAFRRLATAVAKYWVCKRGPQHAYEAMECLGGNGYTEAFPLAMRYREQPVLAIWEGAGNVLVLDVLRAMTTDPDCVEAFLAELHLAHGVNVVFDGYLGSLEQQLAALMRRPADFESSARTLVETLALALQASLLIRYSPFFVSDAFVDSRLGPDRSFLYGNLPSSSDLAGILARH